MKKVMLLAALLAMVLTTAVAVPAVAQNNDKAAKQSEKAAKQAEKAAKQAQKAPSPDSAPKAPKEMPKTGGPSSASLLALGVGSLLVGGGLLVRRITR